jgi:putative transposase
MREKIMFVGAAKRAQASFTSLCAAFGITPKTGYKWLYQFDRDGLDGLVERSRRPLGNSRAIATEVAERLVVLREDHPTWGPRKLVAWLSEHEPQWDLPAASTVGDLLKRRGLIGPPRQRLRWRGGPRATPLSHATAPNAVWAMDFKGWFRVGDRRRCDPLTITDAFSRYLLCCDAHEEQFGGPVWRSLVRTFSEYGLPSAIRVDNGQPWVSPKGELGLTTLGVKLLKLGITVERIQKGKPQQNGRHERFHLTLKQETAQPPASTLRKQQARFDEFKREYNHDRPHEALGQRPPARIYAPSLRQFPSKLPTPEYPWWMDTRPVRRNGRVRYRGVEYFVTTALSGEPVGLFEVEQACYAVFFADQLLGRIHAAHPDLGMVPAY